MTEHRRWLTPNRSVAAALVLVAASAVVAPRLVYTLSSDGGFVQAGEKINLGRWTHVSAQRNGGPTLGINRPDQNAPSHYESWINAGQWLRFDHVPVTQRSLFTANVRVHPEWPRDRATDVTYAVSAHPGTAFELGTTLVLPADSQTEWTRIELDLSDLAGQEVDIKIAPTANQDVWTLMRDPRIEIAPPRDPR
jgi:hypothetical protein